MIQFYKVEVKLIGSVVFIWLGCWIWSVKFFFFFPQTSGCFSVFLFRSFIFIQLFDIKYHYIQYIKMGGGGFPAVAANSTGIGLLYSWRNYQWTMVNILLEHIFTGLCWVYSCEARGHTWQNVWLFLLLTVHSLTDSGWLLSSNINTIPPPPLMFGMSYLFKCLVSFSAFDPEILGSNNNISDQQLISGVELFPVSLF